MRKEFGIFKRKDKKVYYYTTYINGRRVFKSTGCKTKAEALNYCLALSSENKLHKVDKTKLFKDFTISFFEKDSEYIKQLPRKITETTRYTYDTLLKKKIAPFFDSYYLQEITPSLIRKWLSTLEGKEKTINYAFLVLNMILKEACFQEFINFNPCNNVRRLATKENQRECFTNEEIKKLFISSWEREDIKLICKISSLTGMRKGEILALTLEKINKYFILVDSSIEQRTRQVKSTKNNKPREVPITEKLYNEILTYADNRKGFIFRNLKRFENKPISHSLINTTLTKQLKTLGIYREGLCFHSFRHFFNSKLLMKNVNSEIVRKIVGHENENMTEHYLHINEKELDNIRKIQEEII